MLFGLLFDLRFHLLTKILFSIIFKFLNIILSILCKLHDLLILLFQILLHNLLELSLFGSQILLNDFLLKLGEELFVDTVNRLGIAPFREAVYG